MVSHFDEIDVVVITEGFASGQTDEELDSIKDQVHTYARLLAERVDVKPLLTGP
jgi:hypothetical protein